MKRYVIGFWGAYLLSAAVSVGMFFLAIANWLFSDSPPWFDMLFVIAILLPFPAMGDFLAHKVKSDSGKVFGKTIIIQIAIQIMLAILGSFLLGEHLLQVIVWPGTLPGSVLREALDLNHHWDDLFPVIGHILLPVLYHLGWLMGKPSEKE